MEKPDIPGWSHFVGSTTVTGDTLSVRLVPESILESEATAFEVQAVGCTDIASTVAFLKTTQERDDYVYAYWRDDELVIEDESGNETSIRAQSFSGSSSELNAEELRGALGFSQKLLESANAQRQVAERRIHRVREALHEQAKRLRVKADSHDSSTGVGIVYRQHIEFIERLLRETEA